MYKVYIGYLSIVESQIPNQQKSLYIQKEKSASGSKNDTTKLDLSLDTSLSSYTLFILRTKKRKDRFKTKGKDKQGNKPNKKRKYNK